MRYLLPFLFWSFFAGWSGGLAAQAADSTLIALLDDRACLVDVRSPAEYAAGSAPGAVNIPFDSLAQHQVWLAEQTHIIVFCQAGVRSKRAQNWLESQGFTNVANGGNWQRVKDLVPPRQPE